MTNLRLTSCVAATISIGFVAWSSPAQVTLNVMAQSRITAAMQHQNEQADCIIQGLLEDELGTPLPNQELVLRAEQPKIGEPITKATFKACDENGGADNAEQSVSTRTNEVGKFCVRVRDCMLAPPETFVSITFAGGGGYESAGARVSLDAAQPAPTLTVLEGPSRIALGETPVAIAVQLSAQARTTAELPISLSLLNTAFRERKAQEMEIATTKTDSAGIARFNVSRDLFGAPGPSQLRAQFSGSKDLKPASVQWAILKTCAIQLQARLEQPSVQVGDALSVDVAASSACGTVDEGSIELALNRRPLAAIALRHGKVQWHLSTFDLSPGVYSLYVRYVPASAGYVADSPQSLELQLTPVSLERRALWWVSGGVVLLWLLWRYLRRSTRPDSGGKSPERVTKPQSLEVEPSSTPEFGWVGAVYDSHTGAPITGATVTVLVPSFEGVRNELNVVTGNDGAFEFPHRALAPQSKLSVAAPGYLRAQWPMPKPGKLLVRVETRRRAVIRTFVQWADKTFPRTSSVPEPTPADVRAAAEQHALAEVREWASHVEQAAFGPEGNLPTSEPIPDPPTVGLIGPKPRR